MQEWWEERGLSGTRLLLLPPPSSPAGTAPRVVEGPALSVLLKLLGRVEDSLEKLERSGLNVHDFLGRATEGGLLPTYRVTLLGREEWRFTPEEVEAFRRSESQRLGREVQVGDESPLHAAGAAAPNGAANRSAEARFPH